MDAATLIDKYKPLFPGRTMRFHSEKMVADLLDLVRYFPVGSIGVEIGCFAGESALVFARTGMVARLHCVDPWPAKFYRNGQVPRAEQAFDRVAGMFDVLTKHKKRGVDFLHEAIKNGDRYDFIYIDGDHSYAVVKEEIQLALAALKPDGLLCGHDYSFPKSPGVKRAVKEVLGFPDVRFAGYSWLKFKTRVQL